MVGYEYVPGAIEPTGSRDRVPVVVIGPPVKPVPLLTCRTVPGLTAAREVLVTVRFPAEPVMLMPAPAVRVSRPVFVMVTVPTPSVMEIPGPEKNKGVVPDPVAIRVPSGRMLRPLPTTKLPSSVVREEV
jgi:hypothetical protein